jgi:hypothetical protein
MIPVTGMLDLQLPDILLQRHGIERLTTNVIHPYVHTMMHIKEEVRGVVLNHA